jgi:uncharacterized protein YkwD
MCVHVADENLARCIGPGEDGGVLRINAFVLPTLVALTPVAACDEHSAPESEDDARTVPKSEYCEPAQAWDSQDAQLEARAVSRILEHRASGADCGEYGRFRPAGSLDEIGALRCAARVHALDMAGRSFFAHENPDEETTADRVAHAGGRFAMLAEAIAVGDIAPERVVDEIWMKSPGSCATLMGDAFEFVGVGVTTEIPEADESDGSEDGRAWWTVVIAR